jgi:hypothetical protein
MVGAEDGESLQKVDQNRIVRRNHDSDEKLHNSRGQNRLESSRPYIVNKCLHIHRKMTVMVVFLKLPVPSPLPGIMHH